MIWAGQAAPAGAAADAPAHGIRLAVVKPAADGQTRLCASGVLPRRWVAELSCAWTACFRRLARGNESSAETLAGLPFVAWAILLLRWFIGFMVQSA